jgi:hypothetical protein
LDKARHSMDLSNSNSALIGGKGCCWQPRGEFRNDRYLSKHWPW